MNNQKLLKKLLSIGGPAAGLLFFGSENALLAKTSDTKRESEKNLLNVIIISRHGARTPLHITEELKDVWIALSYIQFI